MNAIAYPIGRWSLPNFPHCPASVSNQKNRAKKMTFLALLYSVLLTSALNPPSYAAEKSSRDACPFQSGLHHTARGMAYWYDKANGGLETLTGIPYENLSCKQCHVSSCSRCHINAKDGKALYTTAAAKRQDMCLECHGREALAVKKLDESRNQVDVHFAQGMECHDCHSAREIHGDGVPYVSMKQEGAMDTKCENCHDSIAPSESHTVHKGKLACNACHVRHSLSCANCHFDSLLKEGKRRSIVMSDWVFLINFRNKVTSGNMQTFVVGKEKTFLMFGPQFTHSVMKSGRKCDACHGTDTAQKLKSGRLALTWMENGKHINRKGVVPLVAGAKYSNAYQDFKEGKWVPIKNPHQPEPHYVAFGSPLSENQLGALLRTPDELRKGLTPAEPQTQRPAAPDKH